MPRPTAAFVLWLLVLVCPAARASTCEQFGQASSPLTIVFLHGAAGAEPYQALAKAWAAEGYFVLFPHIDDATHGTSPTNANYARWVAATAECIAQLAPKNKPVVLFGISLGASVALAAGTELPGIDSVVDWAGSLPDEYFYHLKRLPPLLILHGSDDQNIPVINAQQLFLLCDRLHVPRVGTIYKGDGHVFPAHRDDAKSRTRAFLQSRISREAAVSGQSPPE